MTKEAFDEIRKKNCVLECEVENVINFVRDLLEFAAKETEENEPWATKTIDRYCIAAREVGDLLEYIEV